MNQIINRLLDKIECLEDKIEDLKDEVTNLQRDCNYYKEENYKFERFLSENNINVIKINEYRLMKEKSE